MVWNTKFVKYGENKLSHVQNARLLDKCVCDLLSWCAWPAASRKTIKQTSFLQISQQFFYSSYVSSSYQEIP